MRRTICTDWHGDETHPSGDVGQVVVEFMGTSGDPRKLNQYKLESGRIIWLPESCLGQDEDINPCLDIDIPKSYYELTRGHPIV